MHTAKIFNPRPHADRTGFTLTELIVAATLLITLLSVTTQLTVRTGQMRHETRRQQLALNELSNQLDRLTAADDQQRAEWVANLAPSGRIAEILPEAKLVAEEHRDEHGRRLVLKLSWKQKMPAKPLELVGWIDPLPDELDEDPNEDPDESDEAPVTEILR